MEPIRVVILLDSLMRAKAEIESAKNQLKGTHASLSLSAMQASFAIEKFMNDLTAAAKDIFTQQQRYQSVEHVFELKEAIP